MALHTDLQFSTQHIGSILHLQKKLEKGRNVMRNKEEMNTCNTDFFPPISVENEKGKTKKNQKKPPEKIFCSYLYWENSFHEIILMISTYNLLRRQFK